MLLKTALTVLVLPAMLSAQDTTVAKVPVNLFVPPNGPYAVGMHEYFWIDVNRPEPFTKDTADRRHVLARVWYPAEPVPGAAKALYITNVKEFGDSSHYRTVQHVRTNAVMDAPVAKTSARYPVLVYQPGGGTARIAGTFEAEQFASQGYVVVAADHPGFSETVLFPDGYRFKSDTLLNTGPVPQRMATPTLAAVFESWNYLGYQIFPTWLADARYVLDKIEELDHTTGQLFHNRLDLSHIGMYGWSFGGATSAQMSKDDPRVKAAVVQDGQLFGDVRDLGTPRPVLIFNNGAGRIMLANHAFDPLVNESYDIMDAWQQTFLDRSANDWYQIQIARTQHPNFSDLMLFGSRGRNANQLDPRRAHEIITAYTLAFFDKYLRNRDSALLEGPSAAYPEVTFNKKK